MSAPTRLRAVAALALALLPCGVEAAEDPTPSGPLTAAFLERLAAVGTPAREEAVRDLLAEPEAWTAAGGEAAAGALWHAGGHAAASGLCRLVRHTEPAVARAALDGLVAVDLRVDGVASVRRALRDKDPDVRTSAHDALGRMGDVADVEGLLRRLEGDDAPARSLAHRTLVRLTGQTFRTEARRWVVWWEHEVPPLEARLAAAVALLDGEATLAAAPAAATDVAAAWQVVERHGWLDVEGLRAKGAEWLGLWTPAGRAFGYRLAAVQRLGELGPHVARASRRDRDGPAAEAARLACRRLGIPADR